MTPSVGGKNSGTKCGIALLAMATLAALSARADDGPVVVGRRERPPFLTLDPFSGSVGITGQMEYDSSKTQNASTTSSSSAFQQTLSLATGGSIVSRDFFEWHGSATVGAEESWSHSPSENNYANGVLDTYDFSGTLLGPTILPTNFYARRMESYVSAAFQPLMKNTTTEYGAAIRYQSPALPTSLSYDHSETQQNSLAGAPEFTLKEDRVGFQTSFDPTEHQHLSLNYQMSMVNQQNPASVGAESIGGGGESFTTQSAGINHSWQIDNAGHYLLSQSVNYSSEDGSYPLTHLTLGENLHMRFSDTVQSELQYTYDHQQYLSSETQTQQLIGSVTHQLFDSLTTHGQAGAMVSSNSFATTGLAPGGSSDTKSYFANLGFNYSKKVPLGVLGANLALGYNQTENGAIGAVQPVVNDFQTFTDPQPIVITRTNVDPNSIAVFNAAGTRRYLLNTDYIVTRVGNTIQIDRAFTSNINPGDTVRLDYNVDPLPGYTSSTTSFNTGLNYNFTEGLLTGLTIFGQYAQQDQSTSSTAVLADHVIDTRFGANYRIGHLTLQADREDRQSTLAAFTATRFSALYSDRFSARSGYSLSATQSFIEYPGIGNSTSLTNIGGHIDYLINRDLKAIASARWRNLEDSRFGNNMGFEEQGEIRWTIRQTQIYFMVRHTDVEATSNSAMSISAQFGISRGF